MNRQELAEEVRLLNIKKKMSISTLADQNILNVEEYRYLKTEFERKGNALRNEKWHQFVRFVLLPKDEWEYMYERLARLLNIHKNGFDDYFTIDSKNQIMPDRKSDLIRIHKIYEEFFVIYMKIIKKMHVEYPLNRKNEQIITGKINWKETILKSKTEFPVNFEMNLWNRKFETPENILFFLCIIWLNKEVKKILNLKYFEPLETDEMRILNEVESKTIRLLQNFPHTEIVNKSKKLLRFSDKDKEISKLAQKTKKRLFQGEIKNQAYYDLLNWISKFNQLGLQNWSGNMSKFHIQALENLDTMYEAWIFLEMIDFFKTKKNLEVKVKFRKSINEDAFLEFKILKHRICIYYEKQFKIDKKEVWIFEHKPDFSIFIDNRLIGILDAKNYKKSNAEKNEATNKMMAYLLNLDINFGGLIFPNFETSEYSKDGKFHKNQHLVHYKMKPVKVEEEMQVKDSSLEKIFQKIMNSIEEEIEILK